MFSSLLYNKLDVSGGWLRCIQCVWIWLTTFKALSMLFVLMTSLSLSAVLSCHTCSTSSRLCVLACFRFVCVPISVTSQCLWAMPFHYLRWQSSVMHDHMHAQTPTHTCYLCWQRKLYEELLRQLVHWAEAFLLFILFINSFLKRKN